MTTTSASTLISARVAGLGEAFACGSLVVSGDAAATASNILDSQQLWRMGLSLDLLMHVLDVPLIVFFYLLLRQVNQPLALLATVFNIVQTSVLAINKLTLIAALSLLHSAAPSQLRQRRDAAAAARVSSGLVSGNVSLLRRNGDGAT